MKSTATYCRTGCELIVALALTLGNSASAQPIAGGACKPVSERTGEVGCWIIAHEHMGKLPQAQVFWHLDVYPTRAQAEAAKGQHGTVVEISGKGLATEYRRRRLATI